jgi:hypothetical protein
MMHPVFRPTLADAIIARYTGAQPALPDPAEHVLRQEENADSAASYGTYLENIRSLTQCITENMIVNLRFDFSFVNRLLGGALYAPGAAGAAGRGMPVPPATISARGSALRTAAAVQKAETIPAVLTPQGTTPQGAAKTGAAALTEPARGAASGERPAAAERQAAENESGAEGRTPAQRAKTKSKKARQAPDRPEEKAAFAARTAPAAAQAELIYAAPGGVPAQPGEGAAMAAQPVPAKTSRRASAAPDALQPAGAKHQDVGVRPAASPAAAAAAPAPADSTRIARAAAATSAAPAAAAGPASAPRPKRADAPNGRADRQAALSAGVPIGRFSPAADGAAEEPRPFPSIAAVPERAENGEAGNSTVKKHTAPAPAELVLPQTAAPESTAREGRAAGEEKERDAAHMRPAQAETVQTTARVPRGGKDAAPQAAAAQQPAGRRQSAAAPGRGAAQGMAAGPGRGTVPGIPAPPWKPSPTVLTKEAAPTSPADAAAHISEAAHAPRAGAELVLADAAALPAQQTRTPRAVRHFAGAPQPAAEGGAGPAARPAPAEHESFPKAPAGMSAPWKAAENHAGTAPAAPAYPLAETVHAAAAYPLAETVHAAADTQPAAGAPAWQEHETVQGAKAQGAVRPAAAKNEAAARAPDFAPAERALRRPAEDRAAGRAAGEAQTGSAEAHTPRLPRAPQAAQTDKTPKAGAKTAAAQEMPAAVRRQEAFLARLAAQPAAKRARTAQAQIVPAADAADAFAPDRARPAAQAAPAAHFSGAELLYRSEAAQDAPAPAAAHAPENDIETIRTVRRETQRAVNTAVHREVHTAPPQTMENADPAAVTELAEKVYRRIEQRLKNEKWRRGL